MAVCPSRTVTVTRPSTQQVERQFAGWLFKPVIRVAFYCLSIQPVQNVLHVRRLLMLFSRAIRLGCLLSCSPVPWWPHRDS